MGGAQSTYTFKLATARAAEDADILRGAGYEIVGAPHALWQARGAGCTATFYRSGKLVIQGRDALEAVVLLDLEIPEPADPGADVAKALALHPDPPPDAWIGTDETGKGDYFGPLIVAAACIERDQIPFLAELGVTDSKRLGDKKILDIATELKKFVPHKLVVLGPETYNRLYGDIGNLNRLLAWAHARAITDLYDTCPVSYVLTDKFADERLLARRVAGLKDRLRLDQRVRAESDPAVAVASILARAELVWQIRRLSKQAGFTLPKGAGAPVLAAGKRLLAEAGREALPKFAKVHFSTTKQIGG